ncbi:MAG: VWA domain-containing protein, partial [Clostridiales bacterium]|nr:VWA domain-containing protein [Clostridiales bacterium]
MTNFKIGFSNPWLLFLLIPAIALTLWPYFRLAKQYRRNRNRIISVVLHMIVMVLSIALISGISFSYELPNKENEILLLVDSSFSNRDAEERKESFIEEVINDCGSNYRVGVVKFGFTQVYAAPLSNDSSDVYKAYLASDEPDTSATDIAAALRYASGLFNKPETAKIVLLSDGVETDGNAYSVIRGIASERIKVDVVSLSA